VSRRTPPDALVTEVPGELARFQRPALIGGALLVLLCVAAALMGSEHFFRSYLLAFLFWTGIAVGCLAIAMLNHVTGGAWGAVMRRPLESGARTLPLMALLFVPIALSLHRLYEWSHAEALARDPLLRHKSAYLNAPFFIGRTLLYFAGWIAFSWLLSRWSLEQDRAFDPQRRRRLQMFSSLGLVVYGLTVTFASIDWVMSLEPHWYSTMYGVLFIVGQALAAFSLMIAVTVLLARREPLSAVVDRDVLHDLGKLLLAFVMLWSYVAFSQFLIIWSGNLPEEVPWYLNRLRGGWGAVGLLLVVFHFLLPFLVLLSRGIKRNARLLGITAALVLVMRFVDLLWLVLPAFSKGKLSIHWMDVALPLGIGGLWIALFLWHLGRRRLVPANDPSLVGRPSHG
jgi:hypothetical protein